MYPGATEVPLVKELWSYINVPEGLSKSNYIVGASPSEVVEWYEGQLANWNVEQRHVLTLPEYKAEAELIILRSGENGLIVFAISSLDWPDMTLMGLISGPWELVEQVSLATGSSIFASEESFIDWSDARVFSDPEGDFWLGEGSPPQVIPFPPCDILKVYVMEDGTWLYFKFELAGELPKLPLNYEGDTVVDITWVVVIDKDYDLSTGDMGGYKGSDVLISFGLGPWGHPHGYYYFYDPNGWEGCDRLDPNTGMPIGDLSDREINAVEGGIGKNYVAFKIPLYNIGVEKGDRLRIATWVEAESEMYHHFARDEAPPQDSWYEFKVKHQP